jgi:hypothetical protein
MNRSILVCALMFVATVGLGAQDASQANPYQGTSTPPPDDTIVTTSTPQAKPPAGRPATQAQSQPQSQPATDNSDPDGGAVVVQPQSTASQQPALIQRSSVPDPDGDMVHPHPLRPGELPEGTTIRVRLLDRLSTVGSEKGEAFHTTVASDVMLGGQVLIPAGTEIDGRVVEVSSGHAGGHGTMHLRPETLILSDGTRYHLRASITGTPGAKSKVGSEGGIVPGSRLKRDSVEYGGAVGAGATTGAIVGGPVGALTGSLIGAGVITAHLLISHPQATLQPGTAMIFTLTDPLDMVPADASENTVKAPEN